MRLCAEQRNLPSCALCEEYPCKDLAEKFVDPDRIVEQAGGSVPEEEYMRFIEPYDSKKVLGSGRGQKGRY